MLNIDNYVIKFDSKSQSKLDAAIDMFAVTSRNPDTTIYPLMGTLLPSIGSSVFVKPLAELLPLVKESVVQNPINHNRVLNILTGDMGLLKGYPLLQPLTLGELSEGEYTLEGGRHRLAAILTLAHQLQLPLDKLEVPYILLPANPLRVISDNGSRGVTRYEKAGMTASSLGFDINDPDEVLYAYIENKLQGTPTAQRSTAVRLLSVAMASHPVLTDDTVASVGVTFVANVFKKLPKAVSKQAATNPTLLRNLVTFMRDNLDAAISYVEEMGVSNYARATTSMAAKLSTLFINLYREDETILYGGACVEPPYDEPQPDNNLSDGFTAQEGHADEEQVSEEVAPKRQRSTSRRSPSKKTAKTRLSK